MNGIIRFLMGAIVLAVSFAGFFHFIFYRFKIRMEFIPVAYLAILDTILMFAGYLNVLKPTIIAITFAGVFLFVYGIWKKESYKEFINTGLIFGMIITLSLIISLWGSELNDLGGDVIVHWGLIVRGMLKFNRFPDTLDTVIHYQAYPMGTSVIIYYFSKICGGTYATWRVANNMILIAAMLPAFAFIQNNRIINSIMTIAGCCFFLNYNLGCTGLMVDNILPVSGLAALMFAYYYRNELKEHVWLLSFMLCFVVYIKNSGVFFAAMACIIPLIILIKDRDIKSCIILVVSPVLSFYLWKRHYTFVFPYGGLTSNHAMSIANYRYHIAEKGTEEIKKIAGHFLRSAADIKNNPTIIVLAMMIIIALVAYKYARNKWKAIILASAGYLIYEAGLMAMYIVSMGTGEADKLNSIQRYEETFTLWAVGILAVICITVINEINFRTAYERICMIVIPATLIILVICILPAVSGNPVIRTKSDSTDNYEIAESNDLNITRKDILEATAEHGFEPYKKYLVYISDSGDEANVRYGNVYELWSDDVQLVKRKETYDKASWSYLCIDKIRKEDLEGYDFLIIEKDDAEIRDALKRFNLPYEKCIDLSGLKEAGA